MSDLEILLRSINGLHRRGKDLTYSPEFDEIQKLREFDDPTLEQGEWIADLKVANWPEVVKRCSKLLREDSKDLRVAGWLTEGWVYTQGFSGLAQGYNLIAGLVERYWDDLFPAIEDGDDVEQRVGCLAWVLKQSLRWVSSIPVVDDGVQPYTLSDYAVAHQRSGGARLGDSEHVTLEQLERARAATPVAFYRHQRLAIQEAAAALSGLEHQAKARLGDQAPRFAAIREALDSACSSIQRFAKEAGVDVHGGEESTIPVLEQNSSHLLPPPAVPSVTDAQVVVSGIASREEALNRLREVADYFRQAEPHSPVAYMANQAAEWGGMPLHEWLKVVLKDDAALVRLEQVLGVAKAVESGG